MIKGTAILGGFLGLLVMSSSVNAQGWCESQARLNEAERTICSSDYLRRLDRQLSELYRKSDVSTGSERAWIARRNECGNSERCLEHLYKDRIYELGGDDRDDRDREPARTVCFVVTETPYGYLPLREKPAGKILEKLHKGDTLNADVSALVGSNGDWLPVFTARGGVGPDYLAEGWVYRKHLKAGCRQ
jgi:hypothetical protein